MAADCEYGDLFPPILSGDAGVSSAAAGGRGYAPHGVATGHLHVPAWEHFSHPVQHAYLMDVRGGARTDVWDQAVFELLFLLRGGRGIVRGAGGLSVWESTELDDRGVGGDLWAADGEGDVVAGSHHFIQFPVSDQDEVFRGHHWGDCVSGCVYAGEWGERCGSFERAGIWIPLLED